MREIKFRGKRVDNGEWVYGYYCFNPFFSRAEIFSFDSKRSYVYEVSIETVGEFTGEQDKNGIDIYEDDIMPGGRSENGVVFYENGTFTVWGQPIGWDVESYTDTPEPSPTKLWANVIGNTHDNPELIKQ